MNLEQDLHESTNIKSLVRSSDCYAQNLYAALCNITWRKNEAWEILKGSNWSTSWRGAGRIISELREDGNYMDWYCSGMIRGYDEEMLDAGYVQEGTVTDQIKKDLAAIGWIPIQDDEDQ